MPEQQSNVVSLSNHPLPSLQGGINTALQDLLQKNLYPICPAAVSSLIEFISDRMESSTSNSQIMRFMEAGQILKNSQQQLLQAYSEKLESNFTQWEASSVNERTELTEGSLCLVDNSALEQKLVWQSVAKQLSTCEQVQRLYNFESRLSEIMVIDSEQNPIGALKLCESFSDTLSTINLEPDISQELLAQFIKQIKPAVAALWQEADEYLADMGLELKAPKISNSADTTKTTNETSLSSDNTDNPADSTMVDSIARKVVSRVESLLKEQGQVESSGADAATVSFATADLAFTLTSIQNELSGQHASIFNLSESIKAELKNRGVTKSLSMRQEDLINMIGLLFEYIIDDHELPEEVKKLIGLLQIPVLKLALLENEFLSNRSHPGRLLLNSMTSAGMHCSSTVTAQKGLADFTNSPLQPSKTVEKTTKSDVSPVKYEQLPSTDNPVIYLIEKTVKNIIRSFTDNPNIFTESLEAFSHELSEIETNEWLSEFTNADTARPKIITSEHQKIDNDLSSVESIISSFKTRYIIPPTLNCLIDEEWKQVLQFSHEQPIPDDDWYYRINTLEILLWNLQEGHQEYIPPDDWLTLKKFIIDLLSEVKVNPFIISEWLQAINALITFQFDLEEEIVIEQNKTDNTDNPLPLETSTWHDDDFEYNHEPVSDIESLSSIQKFKVGQWVEFIGKNERSLHCKLATIDDVAERYIFVNKSGMKVAEWSLTDLEKLINDQKVKILENDLFFDRALHAVMDKFLKF